MAKLRRFVGLGRRVRWWSSGGKASVGTAIRINGPVLGRRRGEPAARREPPMPSGASKLTPNAAAPAYGANVTGAGGDDFIDLAGGMVAAVADGSAP